MAEFKNLLQTMSSVFNNTKDDQNSVLDINDDKTLKWKTLHHNQYASKKDGKKTRNNVTAVLPISDVVSFCKVENVEIVMEDESWDCNSSTSSEPKSYVKTRRCAKNTRNEPICEEENPPRKSKRLKKTNVQQNSEIKLSIVPTEFNHNKDNSNILLSTNLLNNNTISEESPSALSFDDEVFYSFGKTIALQLKELNKFNKIEAHESMKEIQNLVATRIVKILAQEEGNHELISRTSPSPE